jgi:hypothetical protein
MGMTTQELQTILDQLNKAKEEMLQDVKEKCAILGLTISGEKDAPKQRRKRRTKAEIAADNAKSPPMPTNTL